MRNKIQLVTLYFTHLQFSKNSGRRSMSMSMRTLKMLSFFMVVMAESKSSMFSAHFVMDVMPRVSSNVSEMYKLILIPFVLRSNLI